MALACELPSRLGIPLSRLDVPDIATEIVTRAIAADISGTTIWRWLSEAAIRPWRSRSSILPRDPNFEAKAGQVLDLYTRTWEGKPSRTGLRDLRRREDVDPSQTALPPHAGAGFRAGHGR